MYKTLVNDKGEVILSLGLEGEEVIIKKGYTLQESEVPPTFTCRKGEVYLGFIAGDKDILKNN